MELNEELLTLLASDYSNTPATSLGKRKKKYRKLDQDITMEHFSPVNILDVTSELFYRCPRCCHIFSDAASLSRHSTTHHPDDTDSPDEAQTLMFVCPKCAFRAESKPIVYKHLKEHHASSRTPGCSKVYNCPYCLYKTLSGAELRGHIEASHIDERQFKLYKCNRCEFRGQSNCAIKKHTSRQHDKELSSGESSAAALSDDTEHIATDVPVTCDVEVKKDSENLSIRSTFLKKTQDILSSFLNANLTSDYVETEEVNKIKDEKVGSPTDDIDEIEFFEISDNEEDSPGGISEPLDSLDHFINPNSQSRSVSADDAPSTSNTYSESSPSIGPSALELSQLRDIIDASSNPLEPSITSSSASCNKSVEHSIDKELQPPHEGRYYKCPDCPRNWMSSFSLQKHLIKTGHGHGFGAVAYPLCKTPSPHSVDINLKMHQLKFLKFLKFPKTDFSEAEVYERPRLRKNYACPDCDKIFGTRSSLNKHLTLTKHAANAFCCDICKFRTLSDVGLKYHLNRMHGVNVKDIDCNYYRGDIWFRPRTTIEPLTRCIHRKHYDSIQGDIGVSVGQYKPAQNDKEERHSCPDCGHTVRTLRHLASHWSKCRKRLLGETFVTSGPDRKDDNTVSELDSEKVRLLKGLNLWPLFHKRTCASIEDKVPYSFESVNSPTIQSQNRDTAPNTQSPPSNQSPLSPSLAQPRCYSVIPPTVIVSISLEGHSMPSVTCSMPSETCSTPSVTCPMPSVTQPMPSVTNSTPAFVPSMHPMVPSTPPVTPSAPSVTPSTPPVTPSIPPVTHSIPPVTPSTPPVMPSTPPMTPSTSSATPSTPPVTPSRPPVTPSINPLTHSIAPAKSSTPPAKPSTPPVTPSTSSVTHPMPSVKSSTSSEDEFYATRCIYCNEIIPTTISYTDHLALCLKRTPDAVIVPQHCPPTSGVLDNMSAVVDRAADTSLDSSLSTKDIIDDRSHDTSPLTKELSSSNYTFGSIIDRVENIPMVSGVDQIITTDIVKPLTKKIIEEEDSLDCNHCNFTALSKKDLKFHLKSHSGISYQCNLCEYESSSHSRLIKHRINIHNVSM